MNSHELTVGNERSLWNGACVVILRSLPEAGDVTVKASAPGLKPATVKTSTAK